MLNRYKTDEKGGKYGFSFAIKLGGVLNLRPTEYYSPSFPCYASLDITHTKEKENP
jgi:hypothetical protein